MTDAEIRDLLKKTDDVLDCWCGRPHNHDYVHDANENEIDVVVQVAETKVLDV
jgi:hypothetical protein